MFKINEKPPGFASRAIGILEGKITLDLQNGCKSIVLTTDDGAEIPGVAQGRAAERIIEDPSLLFQRVRLLVYPRTERSLLKFITVDVELAPEGEKSKQSDVFLIQGFNIGKRSNSRAQIAIRPNKRSKHTFEKFWINLQGHLTEDLPCVYQVKAIRKGRKLFIIQSEPQLPKGCTPPKRRRENYSSSSKFQKGVVTVN